jgi:UDP-glucose 4-epimerase
MESMPELRQIVGSAVRGAPIAVTKNAGLQFIWAGDLAAVYSAVLGSAVNREVFTSLSPDFITWEEIARWAVDGCGSSSQIVAEDKGLAPALTTYDVSAIEREFGLRFDAARHLREHLAYLGTA